MCSSSSPKMEAAAGCSEHNRLLNEFGDAVRELLALHEQQFAAIVEGDGECSRFDLLILDIHMPELDGFEVTSEIRRREHERGGHLPVVALTARSRIEDRERCVAAGMDEFLTKPFRADDLWAVLERIANRPVRRADRLGVHWLSTL